ncbi:hypothetical protein ASPACDRAFT_65026 [Aspergillus aculeatus ATCC 16872]|uniref:Uncharacterized protein n=1 Tax=Aspergillus aculeatus (strain ATCC 16872 / CBS 172.66 / WB 5094) TaxID=690307 RepID=A0A1L9WF12_ASPA1|nr:uncharacterized protein ASPACDRAFT_65026 [Aspergillus aculeatus ATCC 16872]OJJ94754.1 hypothetical protein ASPACDRAFT_65026 [Aspergillus aculeatus ATCC 16872]
MSTPQDLHDAHAFWRDTEPPSCRMKILAIIEDTPYVTDPDPLENPRIRNFIYVWMQLARADPLPPARLYGIIICGDQVRLYTEFPRGHEHHETGILQFQHQGREVFSSRRDEAVFREFMDVVQALRYEDMERGQVDRAYAKIRSGELPPPEERARPENRGPWTVHSILDPPEVDEEGVATVSLSDLDVSPVMWKVHVTDRRKVMWGPKRARR